MIKNQQKIMLIFSAFIALLSLTTATAFADEMTLKDCLKATMANNSLLKASNMEIAIKENAQKSVRGHFLPVIKVEADFVVFDDDLPFELGDMATLFQDPGLQGFLGLLSPQSQAVLAGFATDPILMREQITFKAGATIAQPLTQLYKIYAGYKAAGEMANAARMDTEKNRRKLQLTVAETYYGLITAKRLAITAKAGLKQVTAYERQVKAFMEAEMIEKNALLKIQVQKAQIKKGLFQAEKGIELAQTALNMLMNRPFETPIEPISSKEIGDEENLLKTDVSEQQNKAASNHPEVKSIRHKMKAAKMGKHAAIADMLPEISAFFKYENAQGYGLSQPENMYYGGLTLSWNIWEWGATFYKIKEAKARLEQATFAQKATSDQVRFEVKVKRLDLEEALQNLQVANAQLIQAKENLRVEQLRYEVQETTTTDMLQAQTLALQAENDSIVAVIKIKSTALAVLIAMGNDLL